MIMLVWTGFEFVGTIAFAASGAVVAIRKELDLFGVLVLSVITAIGGGVLRDMIIGNAPPLAFRDATYIMISLVTVAVVSYYYRYIHRFRHLLQICDALGLGAFTATSATMAIAQGWDTLLVVVTLGVVTSVGGGIMRDVLAGEIPMIFQKEGLRFGCNGGSFCPVFCPSLFFRQRANVYLLCHYRGNPFDLSVQGNSPSSCAAARERELTLTACFLLSFICNRKVI